jgi:acyl carrier protein
MNLITSDITMLQSQVTARVRDYVTENFLYLRPDFSIGENDSLLGKGIIDSMGVIEVITFVQDEFGITIADDDITEENLGTLAAIARYVVNQRQKSLVA